VALGGVSPGMTNRSKVLRDTKGQALVEFALLLPLVMLILIGIVEFGRAWQAKQTLTDVAREAARLSVIADQTLSAAKVDSAVNVMIAVAGFDSSTVTVTWPEGCHWASCSPIISTGKTTAVTLTMPYQFVVLHKLAQLMTNSSGTMTLSTTARMRVE
jgi:Flp pilus assembly protein TadG